MLKIHEFTTATGALSEVFLTCKDGALCMVDDEGTFALSEAALAAVMKRYGAPFDLEASVAAGETLDLGRGASLRHVRHLSPFDVIALDYLVYVRPDHEPWCALATTVSGALAHLARAAKRRASALD